jgi:hypothetical protein
MTWDPSEYIQATAVRGLPADRQQRLLAHLEQLSRLAPEAASVPPAAVARCAAVLLALDTGQRLSAPTAVAQALALTDIPALVQVFEGTAVLSRAGEAGRLGSASVYRDGFASALRFLAAELERGAARMENR